eukprot:CAMPEP_0175028600 /NCGR_PEP_ID=MMETSP0005-20121125/19099_1 /TAXON_ID=420556 /ORGANISM="Ochromonas sp., Strain CCMP1393" /LENGTH=124 /DNA_ID=CAMNT_0016288255 /DNA_START=139 /DNA_END=513 /DNA_ORIENTATION=-
MFCRLGDTTKRTNPPAIQPHEKNWIGDISASLDQIPDAAAGKCFENLEAGFGRLYRDILLLLLVFPVFLVSGFRIEFQFLRLFRLSRMMVLQALRRMTEPELCDPRDRNALSSTSARTAAAGTS